MPNSESLVTLMFMNTLGMTILENAFKTASFLFTRSNSVSEKKLEEYKENLAFIQGTGLEIMLDTYHIVYDANKLRNGFFTIFNRKLIE